MTNSTHLLARQYRDAGISIHPLKLDGTKGPALSTWNPYRERLATDAELDQWFKRPAGIGMIAGVISGGLEILDFDDGSLFSPWRSMVDTILERLPVVETPSGGWHVLYRCDEIGGNSKIAMDPTREKKTLIESRGEGGYVAAEGTPCETHASGLPYCQYSGPRLPTIPRITPAERTELWRAARTFDRADLAKQIRRKRERLPRNSSSSSSTEHPVVAAFNDRTSWSSLLEPHGWTTRDDEHWTRPGKSFGCSARVVVAGDNSEVLTVFSANAGPLSPTGSYKSWNKFAAWTALEFQGDNRAAFNAARQEVTV